MPAWTVDATRSAAGTRGFVFMELASKNIMNAVRNVMTAYARSSNQAGYTWPRRAWVDSSTMDLFFRQGSGSPKVLPVDEVTFKTGDEFYESAGDAVPEITKVKTKRIGGFSHECSFPLIIHPLDVTSTITNAYSDLSSFTQNMGQVMRMATSLSIEGNDMWPGVLSEFSLSASGVDGGAPIQGRMKSIGITGAGYLNHMLMSRVLPVGAVVSDDPDLLRDHYSSSTLATDLLPSGGRTATIKDCLVTLDEVNLQQVVDVKMRITQKIGLRSTAGYRWRPSDGDASQPVTANALYVDERRVEGEISFLASNLVVNTQEGVIATGAIPKWMSSEIDARRILGGLAGKGWNQWAAPISIAFGPMTFRMKAAYIQPVIHQLSTGSPLVTLRFIARASHASPNSATVSDGSAVSITVDEWLKERSEFQQS